MALIMLLFCLETFAGSHNYLVDAYLARIEVLYGHCPTL
jgi:hypothetical protein